MKKRPKIPRPTKIQRVEFRDTLYRRRYLVPNAVTLGNLFCGFLAIIYSSSGRFENAAIAIGVAILLDGLDGRVARRLNATSEFGLEFDSFSDLVSFGVAPAILMYHWCFLPIADEIGVLLSFLFALCSASRLARFNISSKDLRRFTGLPTPAAAGVVAALVHCWPGLTSSILAVSAGAILMLVISYLMVSKIEFFSIKQVKFRSMQVAGQILIGAVIALLWYNNRIGFVVLAFGYIISGLLPFSWRASSAAKEETEDSKEKETA